MTDPIRMLMDEHQEALRELEILDRTAGEIRDQGFQYPVWEQLKQAVVFIAEDIRAHNQREEDFLFPAMEQFLPQGGPTGVMRAEHRQLWEGYGRLSELTETVKEKTRDIVARVELAKAAHYIYILLTNHIYKEDNILFPMAQRMLDPEQLDAIGQKFLESKANQAAVLKK